MRGIIETLLQHRFLVTILAAALLGFGITQLPRLPVDVLPEFSPPSVEIQTEALGLSSEEVEQLITIPLEHNLLNGVAWIDKIRSESVSGLSSVTLIFQPGTDLYRARQMVAERLSHAGTSLPRVSKGPVMLHPKSSTSRVLVVRLSSKTLSAIEMSVLARWTITPRLMGVPGVANVAVWGMRDRQLQVQVDPDRLRAHQLSLLQVLESVGNALWVSTLSFVEAATPGNAGFIDTPQQRLGIQHISPIVSPASLAQISIHGTGALLVGTNRNEQSGEPRQGGAVRLLDVADVVENHQPLIGDALAEDGANLLLVIDKFPDSDAVGVTQGIESALATLRPGLSGMDIDSSLFRPATFVEQAKANIARAAIMGSGILVFLSALFCFRWRATLVCLLTIALSLITAGMILHLRGATLNVMVLTGLLIALGFVVSDAIYGVENLPRRLRNIPNSTGGDRFQFLAEGIVDALTKNLGTTVFTTLICILAVLPAFSVPGVAAAFLQPLAITYALTVLASTFVAVTFTPALAALLLPIECSSAPPTQASPPMRWMQARYLGWLERSLPRSTIAYGILGVLAGIGIGVLPLLRVPWLPPFQERDVLIRVQAAPGTSHPEMVRLVNRVTQELRALPGIEKVGALVGRAVLGDLAVGMNAAEILLRVDPESDPTASLAAVRECLAGFPGIDADVQTYLGQLHRGMQPGNTAQFVVRLYGHDWTILRDKAEALRQGLSGMAGIRGLKMELPVNEPSVEVEVSLEAARSHGINPGHVRRAATTLLNGIQVGSLFQEQKVFDVVVWSTPRTRRSLSDIHDLRIDTPFEVPVRLGDVAQARLVPRPARIRHEDVSRYVDIEFDVDGRSWRSVRDEIQDRLRKFQFPAEFHARLFDTQEQQRSDQIRLLVFAAIALGGILLLLQAAYDSWRLAGLSLATSLLTLAGGLASLAVMKPEGLSIGPVFGLLAIFGMTLRHQITLVRDLHQAEAGSAESSRTQQLLQVIGERFPGILMRSVIFGTALLPLAFAGNMPGLEVLRPTAWVILGGMITGIVMNLFVVPVLCQRLGTIDLLRKSPRFRTGNPGRF